MKITSLGQDPHPVSAPLEFYSGPPSLQAAPCVQFNVTYLIACGGEQPTGGRVCISSLWSKGWRALLHESLRMLTTPMQFAESE